MQYDDQKVETAVAVGVIDQEEELNNALSNFRLLPSNAIPIPPTIGVRFQQFFDDGIAALAIRHAEWKENITTFLNVEGASTDSPHENLVRTTVESLVDFTYMRNPQAEVSAEEGDEKDLATVIQKILNVVMNKKTLPGINLRPKVLKQIIFAHLTNMGVLELTYQDKKGSIEQVMEINEQVKMRIKEEEDPEKAAPLYELLDILQRELDVRGNMGIGIRVRSPFAFIFDPNGQELDLSDQKIIMDRDVMKIDHIKAEYTTYDPETKTHYFKYSPETTLDFSQTHSGSISQAREATESAIINQLMPDVDEDVAKLRIQGTLPIVWVYDRTTRLKYLYMEGRWDVPLWVYEDNMELSRFFPFFLLAFSASLNSILQPGEVAHYRSFQKEINKINTQITRIRGRAFTKYLYNSDAIPKEEAEKLFNALNNNDGRIEAIGIKMRDQDRALSEILEPLKIPSTQFKEIFDKSDLKAALDRTTRITDAMRGAQFRTNTTNDAVETYNEFANNRLEGLTDKIELCVEDVLWSLSELIVSKMSSEYINKILSTSDAQKFKNLTVTEFNRSYSLTIAAGSIEKPTSSSKKKEAIQIIQMLGQFGTAAPRTVLSLVTKLLRSAFSKSLVTDDDLAKLEEEGKAAMQKGVSTPQNQPQQNQG
jgi:hypothetical protein